MKLFDKVKNMFTEEIEEEVQVEQVKPKTRKMESNLETIEQIKEVKKKEEEKKPIFFTDDDFNDMDTYKKKDKVERPVEKPVIREEAHTLPYRNTKPYEEVKPVKKFKPTPIISPVYGILDKNYHKEDIVDKTDDYTSVDGLSVDSIRNKAYGTLEDELENTLFGNNSILFNDEDKKKEVFNAVEDETDNDLLDNFEEKKDDDIDHTLEDLENITMDIGKELDSLLSKKTDKEEDEDDLFDLIDNMYEGDEDDDN